MHKAVRSCINTGCAVHVADGVWLVQLLVARRGSQGLASPLAGRLTAMRQQAEAAASSQKEASTSGPAQVSTSLTPCVLPTAQCCILSTCHAMPADYLLT